MTTGEDLVVAKFSNSEKPDKIPMRNQGDIPVVVRLVDDEHGEHFRAAEARRWTQAHVMVGILFVDETGHRRDRLAWLRAGDVFRVLPGSALPDRPGVV